MREELEPYYLFRRWRGSAGSTRTVLPVQEMEGECGKMQMEAEEDFGNSCISWYI